MPGRPDPVPSFASEAEERACWETHDGADRVDWSTAGRARLPNLKPTTTAISLRLPLALPERIKAKAHRRDVPCQSPIKIWLPEKNDTPSSRRPLVPPPHTSVAPHGSRGIRSAWQEERCLHIMIAKRIIPAHEMPPSPGLRNMSAWTVSLFEKTFIDQWFSF